MKAKKVLAMLMASAMIMGTSVTAFAAPGEKPVAGDTMDVTKYIHNVEDGATITAYQVIDAVYNDSGFVKYQWVAGDKKGQDVTFKADGTVDGLTSDYITEVANATNGLTTAPIDALPAGTWMLLVTGSELDKVYNPMIISVYYSVSGSDGTMATDEDGVNAQDPWTLNTSGAYVKSSDPTIKKTVAETDDDTAEVGATKTYTIKGQIPSYSEDSTALYKITDNITNGLKYVLPKDEETIAPTVTIGGNTVPAGKYTVTMGENDKSFTVVFDAAYIKGLAAANTNRNLVITYQAKVTADAINQVAENTATVYYDQGSSESTEYVYTVNFKSAAKKVGVGDDEDGLDGATFTLYGAWTDKNKDGGKTPDELSDVVNTSTTTTDNYYVDFTGLDASETYYLTETAAPQGYTINSTVYTITFEVTAKNEESISYNVLVDGRSIGSVTGYNGVVTGSTYEIQNTKISTLPSTGGMGTTIFTIGGCVIMVTAAGLYFATRKKTEK